ncbi:hypothetical protein TheetDRAFT_2877 [Thermoanaerobacter ethanolicus JW 200]|nr:hypothetical protein TheetDRAFT_2877 [Thermoanaerobacter ethanolicus JW 200]
MQIIFHVDNIEEYLHKGKDYNFPAPPDRCPHPDCKCKVKLKKHGFYYRYYLVGLNCVKIAKRRYICPVCTRNKGYRTYRWGGRFRQIYRIKKIC